MMGTGAGRSYGLRTDDALRVCCLFWSYVLESGDEIPGLGRGGCRVNKAASHFNNLQELKDGNGPITPTYVVINIENYGSS